MDDTIPSDRRIITPFCPECGSHQVSKPDHEGLRDCYWCGVWFPDGDTDPPRMLLGQYDDGWHDPLADVDNNR